jgi:hypothetical protein
MLGNRVVGAQICGLDLNRHGRAHLCRAVQEGVVFSFHYGMEIMKSIGVIPGTVRAGLANMFQSDVFCDSLASVSGATIELYDTDGALGAATTGRRTENRRPSGGLSEVGGPPEALAEIAGGDVMGIVVGDREYFKGIGSPRPAPDPALSSQRPPVGTSLTRRRRGRTG